MKKLTSVLLAIIMLMSLCACGSSSDKAVSVVRQYEAEAAESYDAAMVEAAPAEAYGLAAGNMSAESGESDSPDTDPSKIIYSADATVETTEFEETAAKVTELVDKYGGWIESSSVNGANYYNTARGRVSLRSAYYVMRIPSSRFTELMNTLSTLGNVPYTHTYTENVTTQYYDTQARLTAYETQEARLLEMMELAESIEDIITIEEKLTELRYQIEALQSKLNNWDREVSYSTVNLSIEEVEKYTPESLTKPSYGERLWDAFTDSIEDIGVFFSDFLIILVAALPILVVLGAVGFVAVMLIKRARKKRKAKKDAQTGADNKTE